jgi:hypothetical protein
MSQLCALKSADFIAKLKAAGGVPSLAASLGTLEVPNFDEINRFIEDVVRDAPAGAIRNDVIKQLQPVVNRVF